ncbi:MAG TPA: hypothetical protein PKC25_00735, partial [Candidatus Rifleibacterium sp.]|nr:hypothetical protein [Candidatus Rifleibacterium sp.]
MINPLDDLNFSRNQKSIEELEKLAGFSPNRSGSNKFTAVADSLVKKTERPAERGSEPEIDKYWDFHKSFVSLYERAGRSFALFIGDLLDIILGGPVQTRLVNDMIEEKINRMRKAREAAAEPSTQKHKVQARRNSKYDVVIG